MLCPGADLLHRPAVPVGVVEAEQGAAVALVEDGDLGRVDPLPSRNSRAAAASLTTS
jgi:hypothetical protein